MAAPFSLSSVFWGLEEEEVVVEFEGLEPDFDEVSLDGVVEVSDESDEVCDGPTKPFSLRIAYSLLKTLA